MGNGALVLGRGALTPLVSSELEQGLVDDESAFKPAVFAECETVGVATGAAVSNRVIRNEHVELMLSEVALSDILVDFRTVHAKPGQLLRDAVEG
jgi:hypothetical protein